jgi:hypothetical protein
MEGNYELLRMELTEINTYVRHHFQLFLGWYTFFLTVNFGAIGWFTSVLLTGALKVSLPIVFVTTFFVIQQVFSYVACLEVRKYLVTTCDRYNDLLVVLAAPGSTVQPKSPIPVLVYVKLIGLICSTIITFVFFWLALAVVALHVVPL